MGKKECWKKNYVEKTPVYFMRYMYVYCYTVPYNVVQYIKEFDKKTFVDGMINFVLIQVEDTFYR